MKVLLDECLDPRWAQLFKRHECDSVKGKGWLGKQNGELLQAAAQEFEVFVTIDQNLPHQQNLANFDLVVIVIRESRNDPDLVGEIVRRVEDMLDSAPQVGLQEIALPEKS